MKIIFFFLCASIINANDFESKLSSTFMGKLGGEESVEHSKYKFMASLRRKNVHICTAFLVSNKHSLTTAFCLGGFLNEVKIPDFATFSLVAGKFDIDNGTTTFDIEQVQVHHRYKFRSPNFIHDIGIITLKDNDVKESNYIGWGVRKVTYKPLERTGELSRWENIEGLPRINHLDMKIEDKKRYGFRSYVPMIIAYAIEQNQSLTKKDLGAPLIQNDVVIGILVEVPVDPEIPLTFVDLYKASEEICKIMNDTVMLFRKFLPRKKAKHDCITSRQKRPRVEEFNAEKDK